MKRRCSLVDRNRGWSVGGGGAPSLTSPKSPRLGIRTPDMRWSAVELSLAFPVFSLRGQLLIFLLMLSN